MCSRIHRIWANVISFSCNRKLSFAPPRTALSSHLLVVDIFFSDKLERDSHCMQIFAFGCRLLTSYYMLSFAFTGWMRAGRNFSSSRKTTPRASWKDLKIHDSKRKQLGHFEFVSLSSSSSSRFSIINVRSKRRAWELSWKGWKLLTQTASPPRKHSFPLWIFYAVLNTL